MTKGEGFGVYRLNGGDGDAKPRAKRAKSVPLARTAEAAAQQAAKFHGGEVAAVFKWSDSWYRARIALPDGKKTYAEITKRRHGWGRVKPVTPHCLYRENEIPADGTVYVCEGEPAADAGWSIGLPCVTSGGCTTAGDADWGPLAERDVVVLPDSDAPGEKYAATVVEKLTALDPPARVRVVRLPGVPAGGDLVDYLDARDGTLPEDLAATVQTLAAAAPVVGESSSLPAAIDVAAFLAEPLKMADPIIDGLLRRGEIATLTSSSKSRKSWSALQLCTAVATGGDWFNLSCMRGRVLLVDCELQRATLQSRVRTVLSAGNVSECTISGRLSVTTWRGQRVTLESLTAFLASIPAGAYELIALDPVYRVYPEDFNENDNAAVAALYGNFQQLAERVQAALLVCCHTPKGDMSARSTIDLVAGAGSAGRAVDVAIALRAHNATEPGSPVVVRETIARSFPELSSACFRWQHPRWLHAPELDVADLLTGRQKKKATTEKKPRWNVRRFVERFVNEAPRTASTITAEALGAEVPGKNIPTFLQAAVDGQLIYKHPDPKDKRRSTYSTNPQPVLEFEK